MQNDPNDHFLFVDQLVIYHSPPSVISGLILDIEAQNRYPSSVVWPEGWN